MYRHEHTRKSAGNDVNKVREKLAEDIYWKAGQSLHENGSVKDYSVGAVEIEKV